MIPEAYEKNKKFNLFDRMFIGVAELLDNRLKKNYFANFLINHVSILQYIEFAFVGTLGTLVNAIIYFPLRAFVPDSLAWLLGIIGSFTFNFILNKFLVFNK